MSENLKGMTNGLPMSGDTDTTRKSEDRYRDP